MAFRDGQWDGWACRAWKSGVKLVNAIAAGRPVLTQASAARREIQPPGSLVERPDDLELALDIWTPKWARENAYEECRVLAPRYWLDVVAEQYRLLLDEVPTRCPA